MQVGHVGRDMVALLHSSSDKTAFASAVPDTNKTYHHKSISIDFSPLPLDGYSGKVLLVVNTASSCGFTIQYWSLQGLWDNYKDGDWLSLAFHQMILDGRRPAAIRK